MHITSEQTQQRLAEARALSYHLEKLTRSPRHFTPTAPWIIPATMIFVGLFVLICLVIKLFMNYINSKHKKTREFGLSEASSPDLPSTPEDQASMATTASMKTRGSLRLASKRRRNKPPPVSLYQLKQMQSPGSSATKSKHKAAMKAMSRAAKAEANRTLSRESTKQIDDNSDDNMANDDDNSPTNISQHSEDTDEIQNSANQSGLVYAATRGRGDDTDGVSAPSHSPANQPEVHIVQIRDIEDNLQHSQPIWPQTESEI